jgi:hypothetical protein
MTNGAMRGTRDAVDCVKQRKTGRWSTRFIRPAISRFRARHAFEKEAQASEGLQEFKDGIRGCPINRAFTVMRWSPKA